MDKKIEKLLKDLEEQNKEIKKNFNDVKSYVDVISADMETIKRENDQLRIALEIEREVIIEVGGDHGDGNVEVVKKSKGVKVIIKDWDNAYIPEGADLQDAPLPHEREFEAKVEILRNELYT